MFVFTGCGSTKDNGDKRFTYDWKISSMTNRTDTIYFSENEPLAPEFSSSDGISCVFTNNGKSHNGTIEKKEEDIYTIKFEDSNALMEAEISEDTLTITINDGAMILVFKAD